MSVTTLVPWWAKIGAKVVLSRTRLDYSRWQKLGLFVHGAMDRPAYAFGVVMSHLARVGWRDCEGEVVLELGPGDSLATAVITATLGARHTYLVDAGRFARSDAAAYVELQRFLEQQGLRPPDVSACASLEEMLTLCRAQYFTDGLEGLRRVPPASVDLVFSQAVLEHVRLAEFDETQRQVRRVLRQGGLASHQVDLKDHLGGALNSLRFTHETWESDLMSGSGFYTNRLRFSEILSSMRNAGLAPVVTDVRRWPGLPTPRSKLAPQFQAMSDSELDVSQFDCVACIDTGTSSA